MYASFTVAKNMIEALTIIQIILLAVFILFLIVVIIIMHKNPNKIN